MTPISSRTVETAARRNLLQELRLSNLSAAVIQHRARQTGLVYTMFLMSRCYGTRPHDKWHLPDQLLKNMPYLPIKTDGWSYRAPRRSPQASSLPGDRSLFSLLIVWIAVCFPRRRQHLRDFFYLGIPNNFRAHAGIQTE